MTEDSHQGEEEEWLTPEEAHTWLRQEVADLAKATELRIKEAMALVVGYTSGKLTSEQAEEQMDRYNHRWPEALPGIHAHPDISDEEILKRVDKWAKPYSAPRQVREEYRRLFGPEAGNSDRMR